MGLLDKIKEKIKSNDDADLSFSQNSENAADGGVHVPRAVIVGMGAMGLLYAYQMKKAGFDNICFLMDKRRCDRYSGKETDINGEYFEFECVTPETVKPADIVFVATKTTALDEAAELMQSCVTPNTAILSICNGIESEKILSVSFNRANIIYSVAQGMDVKKFDNRVRFSKAGTLFIGKRAFTDAAVFDRACEFLSANGVSFAVEDNIMLRMWKKFMLNCGVNQSCMVHDARYADAVDPGSPVYADFLAAMKEVKALAISEGYDITDKDIEDYIELIRGLDPDGMPSMEQDRMSHRISEVDTFSGTVIQLAERHGIDVPVNRRLYETVKRIESEY